MQDIYNDGTYLRYNPDAHVSDTFFKFAQMSPLLEQIHTSGSTWSILDIGGGAGVLGHLVSLYFHHRGLKVMLTAADVSAEMLNLQGRSNPFIAESIRGVPTEAFTGGRRYDLTLGIDVFEHIPDYRPTLKAISDGSEWLICNMPIERNLVDVLRNAYMRGRYYQGQTESLGHLHFFSYSGHLREFRTYFDIESARFSPYWPVITEVRSPDHEQQLQNRLRRWEVEVSRWVSTLAPWAAPWIIQGSCFSLSRRRQPAGH